MKPFVLAAPLTAMLAMAFPDHAHAEDYVRVTMIGCPTEQNMLEVAHMLQLGVRGFPLQVREAQMGCTWIDSGMVGTIVRRGAAPFVEFQLGQEGPATGTTWWVDGDLLGNVPARAMNTPADTECYYQDAAGWLHKTKCNSNGDPIMPGELGFVPSPGFIPGSSAREPSQNFQFEKRLGVTPLP